MTVQSSAEYWDNQVGDFDAIYSGDRRTTIGRWLDRWLRRDIYDRLVETTRLVNELGKAQTVLDVGTGTGRLCVPLARAGHRVIGIDFSRQMLDQAEQVTREAGVHEQCRFVQGDALTPLPEDLCHDWPIDAVAILGVFDYISDPLPVLQAVTRYRPKRIVASFPRQGTLRSLVRQWRYRVQRLDCPLFFYSRDEVDRLGTRLGAQRSAVVIMGQLHFACFDLR